MAISQIKVMVEISLIQLNGIIITAVEGGSNYWYEFNQAFEVIKEYKGKYFPEIHGEPSHFHGCTSEAILVAVLHGEVFPIDDIEEQTTVGELSIDRIQKGMELLQKNDPKRFSILLNTEMDYDAEDADVIFQYICLGEVVYG